MTAQGTNTTRGDTTLAGSVFAPSATMGRWLWNFAGTYSAGMRCAREVERLSALSDAELARRGLRREDIARHAFSRLFHL